MTLEIALALKTMRLSHELTQVELAPKLGISKSHLSEIESNKKTPTLKLLQRYSSVFEVPISSILFLAEHIDGDINETMPLISPKIIALLKFIQQRQSA